MDTGERMLANLAMRTVLRKRARRDEPSSEGPARKRPRPAEPDSAAESEQGLPPGLGLGLGDGPAPGPDPEPNDDGEYAPLDVASRRAMDSYIDRIMEEGKNEHTCFFCDMVQRYDAEVERTGGQRDLMTEGAYAYKLAIDFVKKNPRFSDYKKAKGVTEIYDVHVYSPARRALGGRKPPNLPEPSVRDMVEHLKMYNYDLMSMTLEQLETARSLVLTFQSQLVIEKSANNNNARTIIMANDQYMKLTDKFAKLCETQGIPNATFALDPLKVLGFADTRPIDALRKQAEGLGIGGATATNTAEEAQRITARRPAFGGMAPATTVDEEGDADEGDEEV